MDPHQRAYFIVKHLNVFMKNGYRVLRISLKNKFLNIFDFERGIGNHDEGIIMFFGEQESIIINFLLQLILDNNITTEPLEEDMNNIVLHEVNDYFEKLQKQGRIEGQMFLQRLPPLIMTKDIRKKIGKMTGK